MIHEKTRNRTDNTETPLTIIIIITIIIITEVSLGWRSKWSLPSACSQVALDCAARTSLINSPATVNLARAGPRAHCDK